MMIRTTSEIEDENVSMENMTVQADLRCVGKDTVAYLQWLADMEQLALISWQINLPLVCWLIEDAIMMRTP